ncbi:hypothetical protein H9P43_008330 [Blastocladiella emersonii ATCC 22665]|nr:hypothetical protein H9P43_008330 [Blastocladiella emersonii ATCC 22665]
MVSTADGGYLFLERGLAHHINSAKLGDEDLRIRIEFLAFSNMLAQSVVDAVLWFVGAPLDAPPPHRVAMVGADFGDLRQLGLIPTGAVVPREFVMPFCFSYAMPPEHAAGTKRSITYDYGGETLDTLTNNFWSIVELRGSDIKYSASYRAVKDFGWSDELADAYDDALGTAHKQSYVHGFRPVQAYMVQLVNREVTEHLAVTNGDGQAVASFVAARKSAWIATATKLANLTHILSCVTGKPVDEVFPSHTAPAGLDREFQRVHELQRAIPVPRISDARARASAPVYGSDSAADLTATVGAEPSAPASAPTAGRAPVATEEGAESLKRKKKRRVA